MGWEGYVIGMDATSANLDILEAGGIYGLVAQPIYDLWADCARHLDAWLRGENPEYSNFSDAPVITVEDAPAYREILGGVDTVAQFSDPFSPRTCGWYARVQPAYTIRFQMTKRLEIVRSNRMGELVLEVKT